MATIRHHARIASTDVTQDEAAEQMDGILAEGLQGLRAHLETS